MVRVVSAEEFIEEMESYSEEGFSRMALYTLYDHLNEDTSFEFYADDVANGWKEYDNAVDVVTEWHREGEQFMETISRLMQETELLAVAMPMEENHWLVKVY